MDTGVRGHETNASSARIFWTVAACMLMAAPAEGDEPSQDKSRVNPRPAIDSGTGRKPSDPESPGPRSFRLGFTPVDLLSTPEVGKTLSEALSKHTDLVAFHLDLAVPWDEALHEQPLPPAVEQYLARWSRLKGRLRGDRAVYLALTPLRLQRNGIAAYWGGRREERAEMEKPRPRRPGDDPRLHAVLPAHDLQVQTGLFRLWDRSQHARRGQSQGV
jgi:hypothetical protein